MKDARKRYEESAHIVDEEKHAIVIVLSCIDYRFFSQYAKILNHVGLEGRYDQVIMAGAELGACVPDIQPVCRCSVRSL